MTPQQFYDALKEFGVELTEEQKWQLHRYFELLVEWNEKMNLTGITEVNEVYLWRVQLLQLGFQACRAVLPLIHPGCGRLELGSSSGYRALGILHRSLQLRDIHFPLHCRFILVSHICTLLYFYALEG